MAKCYARSFGSQNPNIVTHGSKVLYLYCSPKKIEEDPRTWWTLLEQSREAL
ncbi:hypothetical protein PanWU01x14_322270, partial [Parasponia andersonii]